MGLRCWGNMRRKQRFRDHVEAVHRRRDFGHRRMVRREIIDEDGGGRLEFFQQPFQRRTLRPLVACDPKRDAVSKQLAGPRLFVTVRSEEHTSELQSLMRISYAVFCLKKKK